jgi:hypothetical protein
MGRNIYILALDAEVARNNLKIEIDKFASLNNSLLNFITKYDINRVSEYNELIKIITTDLNLIRVKDLENIYLWYREVYFVDDLYVSNSYETQKEEFEQKLKQLGVELIYEFEGKLVCFHFMYWLGEFEYLNKLGIYDEENESSLTYEISTDTIKDYLDYVLLLLSKVELKKDENWIGFREMERELLTNENIVKQVLSTLEKYEIDDEYFYTSYDFFQHAFEISRKINEDTRRIVIIDNY